MTEGNGVWTAFKPWGTRHILVDEIIIILYFD